MLWGSEAHVRELFGDRVSSLDMTRRMLVERHAGGPEGYVEFYSARSARSSRATQRRDPAALDRDFHDFARRANRGSPAEYHYEYLLVTARRSG